MHFRSARRRATHGDTHASADRAAPALKEVVVRPAAGGPTQWPSMKPGKARTKEPDSTHEYHMRGFRRVPCPNAICWSWGGWAIPRRFVCLMLERLHSFSNFTLQGRRDKSRTAPRPSRRGRCGRLPRGGPWARVCSLKRAARMRLMRWFDEHSRFLAYETDRLCALLIFPAMFVTYFCAIFLRGDFHMGCADNVHNQD